MPVLAALLTPFDSRGEVDLGALRAHVEHLLDHGIDGVMACGTTGEGILLDEEEAVRIFEAAVSAAAGRGLVYAQVGRPSTAATCTLAGRAAEVGVDAVFAVAPSYYPFTQRQIHDHYRTLIDAAGGMDVFAYNIPSHTGTDLQAATAAALARAGLAGLKDSTKSFERHLEYIKAGSAAVKPWRVYMGSDTMVLRALQSGAAGSITALANLRPDLLSSLRKAWEAGDAESASAIQEEVTRVRDALPSSPPLTALKKAVAERLKDAGIAYPYRQRAPLG